MASIVIRGLDDEIKQALGSQAAQNGRSMEAEARLLIAAGLNRKPGNIGEALRAGFAAVGGVEELELPDRGEVQRPVTFDA